MNIEKHQNEDRQRITQSYISEYHYLRMRDVYYNQWGINENDHSIERNALFLTYRVYDPNKPLEPMLDRFKKFYHWQLKRMMGDKRSVKYVYQRQHVGMAAVDFNGSSQGKWVPEEGPHVHSVLVIHPELRWMTMVWFAMLRADSNFDFYYERLSETGYSIQNSIHYCLKGIMNENGFYKNRDLMCADLGPYKEKLQSKVVRVGRVPGLKKPIFKLKAS